MVTTITTIIPSNQGEHEVVKEVDVLTKIWIKSPVARNLQARSRVQGLGFRVQVQGSGFRV